ncbi:MAG: hypothetical protein AW07_01515 [Candidatus Accumulibacter sp. SK-11]|nr:MAG: hypothetical protein AW07_01515 [Candidatus Accumulibacter sp. SK-11]
MIFRLPSARTRRTPRNFSFVRIAARTIDCSSTLRCSRMTSFRVSGITL